MEKRVDALTTTVCQLQKWTAILEDFIHVQFANNFRTFVKNRQHLINLGFEGELKTHSDFMGDTTRITGPPEVLQLLRVLRDLDNESYGKPAAEAEVKATSSGEGHPLPSLSRKQRKRARYEANKAKKLEAEKAAYLKTLEYQGPHLLPTPDVLPNFLRKMNISSDLPMITSNNDNKSKKPVEHLGDKVSQPSVNLKKRQAPPPPILITLEEDDEPRPHSSSKIAKVSADKEKLNDSNVNAPGSSTSS